ncbi:hypothetical protein M409DRAFT_71037 [Zasmidium cellare ATCC 36951]|uniref:D-lactate dehydrogenase (cytochrome) n=1 Tax=Zasmidium cellare ATCC 36951 TaxID=1080233 RepID=A0A6A6BX26_ZASCE|nr:uncharacterized protein M409DRAFT_71037 [Zasmidium cellare ATCC 36951]KAF2159361.1 hypothetical protein M409DRAFT_71037 [Zasmidium cellare ATCC 36951]
MPTVRSEPPQVLYSMPRDTSSTSPLDRSIRPELDVSVANLRKARLQIAAIVGEENIDSRIDEIKRHTGTEWSSHPGSPDEAPAAIVRPNSTEEVSGVMKVCNELRIPVVAFSGGTSLEAQFANTRRGVSLDLSRMDKILASHKDDLDVVVQPGVGYEQLNQALAEQELFFPPDPGPGAMIGGMIGTGCSGTNAYHYGTMKNWVISVTVVLPDGTVIKTRQRPMKSSAGYDLTRLFVGSEGTLGIVTEAVLRVTTLPRNIRVAVASFPSVRAAAECVGRVVQKGVAIAAVELLDETAIKCINESGATGREWLEQPTLFLKFSGTETEVSEEIQTVREMASLCGNIGFVFAQDEEEAEDLWGARKTMLWGSQALKKRDDDRTWITDVAVPMSRLPEIIELTKQELDQSGLSGAIVGHVGDGNFHAAIMYGEDERTLVEDIVHRMVHRAIEMEGTVTGEHGVGLVKRDYLPHELGQSTVDSMRRIKQAFDPLCLLNCDKVIRAEA